MNTISETPLNRAIREAGGISALARELGLSGHAVIHQWRINRVPAEHCPAIEAATCGVVRCEELRPDVQWHVLRQNAGNPASLGLPQLSKGKRTKPPDTPGKNQFPATLAVRLATTE